jgi:hypothetical protein
VLFDGSRVFGVAVMVENEILFVEMFHGAVLGIFARVTRSFRTARKIACFVALTEMSSVTPISASESSSK